MRVLRSSLMRQLSTAAVLERQILGVLPAPGDEIQSELAGAMSHARRERTVAALPLQNTLICVLSVRAG